MANDSDEDPEVHSDESIGTINKIELSENIVKADDVERTIKKRLVASGLKVMLRPGLKRKVKPLTIKLN